MLVRIWVQAELGSEVQNPLPGEEVEAEKAPPRLSDTLVELECRDAARDAVHIPRVPGLPPFR